ncbi:hypothetical protein PVAP13_2NG381503 [Panicum virgatum]|uniref:Uncharacterized protein n=1 Tax=Panicum virgatum TaxID=38727 RepID=A0A8T0VKJ0_PANVG|nr:hypothetical protein PVAP13_2NG381503 [Panicum virgatum]
MRQCSGHKILCCYNHRRSFFRFSEGTHRLALLVSSIGSKQNGLRLIEVLCPWCENVDFLIH